MKHQSFIEPAPRSEGELPIFSQVNGMRYDSVFIQVSVETYITKHFQEWLSNCILPRLTPKCDAVRIAITQSRGN